jgi:hypothetical protein
MSGSEAGVFAKAAEAVDPAAAAAAAEKEYYDAWRSHAKQCTSAKLVEFLPTLMDKLDDIAQNSTHDHDMVHYFLESVLLDIIIVILDKDLSDSGEFQEDFAVFIEKTLSFSIGLLPLNEKMHDNGFFELVSRILDKSNRLYFDVVFGDINIEELPNDHEAWSFFSQYDSDYAQLPQDEYTFTHPIFVRVVNHFINCKAVDIMLDRIRNPAVDIPYVCYFIYELSQIVAFLHEDFVDRLAMDYFQALSEKIRTLTPEVLRRLDKKYVDDSFRYITKIGRFGSRNVATEIQKQSEIQSLALIITYLNSEQLDKKLAGLRDLRNFIKACNAKSTLQKRCEEENITYEKALEKYENENKQMQEDFDPGTVRYVWMRSPVLMEWISSSNILDKLLEADNHMHIIRRSVDVVTFIADQKSLKTHHIDLLWTHTQLKHESDVGAIYEAIPRLCFSLNVELMSHLFEKIAAIPYSQYSESIIKLISAFALIFVNRFHEETLQVIKLASEDSSKLATPLANYHFGFKLLWSSIQEENGCASAIQTLSLQRLNHALKGPAKDFRIIYLNLCIENMRIKKSLASSLKLLIQIFTLFPTQPDKNEEITRSQIMSMTESQHGLLKVVFLLFDHTVRFCEFGAGLSPICLRMHL